MKLKITMMELTKGIREKVEAAVLVMKNSGEESIELEGHKGISIAIPGSKKDKELHEDHLLIAAEKVNGETYHGYIFTGKAYKEKS